MPATRASVDPSLWVTQNVPPSPAFFLAQLTRLDLLQFRPPPRKLGGTATWQEAAHLAIAAGDAVGVPAPDMARCSKDQACARAGQGQRNKRARAGETFHMPSAVWI